MADTLSYPTPGDRQTISCLYCGKPQEIGRKAMSITCKFCNKSLKLEDIPFKGYEARRSIETCGIVTIEKKGNVVSDRILCGGLIVRGKVRGNITSRGPVLVGPDAEIRGDVTAPTLAVGSGAVLDGQYAIGNLATENLAMGGAMTIETWLQTFQLDSDLEIHTAHVLRNLPDEVRTDIMGEAGVVFYDYDPGPGVVMQVPVKIPGPPGRAGASRSIVLKRTLRNRSPNFVHWLIAHELAHAHLRNAGRWPGDDPEVAADSLAGQWGFPRPSRW